MAMGTLQCNREPSWEALKGWDGGGREAQEGGDICVHIADSWCGTAETNTVL